MRCCFGLLVLGLLLTTGCAVRMRELGPLSHPAEFELVNGELGLWHGRAVLKNGDTLRGARFQIRYDSTHWREGRAHERRAFPNGDILNVSVVGFEGSPWKGFKTGVLAGGVSGAVLGMLAGVFMAALYVEPDYSPPLADSLGYIPDGHRPAPPNRLEWILAGAGIGALSGAALGGTVGIIVPLMADPVMVNFRFPLDRPRS